MVIVGIPAAAGIPTHLEYEGMQCTDVILQDFPALQTRQLWALYSRNFSVSIKSGCSPWIGEQLLKRLRSRRSRLRILAVNRKSCR